MRHVIFYLFYYLAILATTSINACYAIAIDRYKNLQLELSLSDHHEKYKNRFHAITTRHKLVQ